MSGGEAFNGGDGRGCERCSLEVKNPLGLHARVAARIAQTVQQFSCRVVLNNNGIEADGSSVLDILTLGAPQGTCLDVRAEGEQAVEAIAALKELFDLGFEENR